MELFSEMSTCLLCYINYWLKIICKNFAPNFNCLFFIWLKCRFFSSLSNYLFPTLNNSSIDHSYSGYFTCSIVQIYFCKSKLSYHAQSFNFLSFLIGSIRCVTYVILILHQNFSKMTRSNQAMDLKTDLFWSNIPENSWYYRNRVFVKIHQFFYCSCKKEK